MVEEKWTSCKIMDGGQGERFSSGRNAMATSKPKTLSKRAGWHCIQEWIGILQYGRGRVNRQPKA